MRTVEEMLNCDFCGADLRGLAYEETHTREGCNFCNYECMENYYGEIPESEEFIIVPKYPQC